MAHPFKSVRPRRALLVTALLHLLLLALLLLYVRIRYRAVRYTAFYDVEGQQSLQKHRASTVETESTSFIHSLLPSSPLPPSCNASSASTANGLRLCLVMVTVPRVRPYLYQALASYLLSFCPPPSEDGRFPGALRRCSPVLPVHLLSSPAPPHPHFEVLEGAFLSVFPTSRTPPPLSDSNTKSWHRKELLDYAAALRLCHEEYSGRGGADERAHHVTVVLEEDVVMTRGMVEKLTQGVQGIVGKEDWLLVRLFRSSYWDGWEVDDWLALLGLALLGGCGGAATALAVLALHHLHTQRRVQGQRKKGEGEDEEDHRGDGAAQALLDTPHLPPRGLPSCDAVLHSAASSVLLCSFVLSAALTVTGCLLLNRQNLPLFIPSPGLRPIAPSAGTQALAFATPHIPALLSFLQSPSHPPDLPIDVALNEYIALTGLRQWELWPHLVDHRGVYSSAVKKNQGEYRYLKVSSGFEEEVDVEEWVKGGWKPRLEGCTLSMQIPPPLSDLSTNSH